MRRKILILVFITGLAGLSFGQTMITQEEAVTKAMQFNRNLKAADFSIKQQKQLVKSAINLPNPEFFWESPTGSFYTGSITQSLDFPTVYSKQVQLQKQQVVLAEKDKMRIQADVAYQVRLLYLAIQYTEALKKELQMQDSVYFQIQLSAQRQFEAGQVDYLQKIFAETEYGELHNRFLQTTSALVSLVKQLQYLTGIEESLKVSALQLFPLPEGFMIIEDSSGLIQNRTTALLLQEIEVNQKNLKLQKSKALPGLAFGYFNQGERETPTRLRFRFGVTIPLWFWQYKSNIQAAKTGVAIAQEKSEGFKQQLNYELMQAKTEMTSNYLSYNYYKDTGLPKAEEIISTAKRFFESGETDYINYLRNISTAYETRLKFAETLNKLNHSILTINYLTGKL